MSKSKPAIQKGVSKSSPAKPNAEQPHLEATTSSAKRDLIKQIREFSAFSGPLPPPQILESYNKIIPTVQNGF
jgi:uncharacterized membrane protein